MRWSRYRFVLPGAVLAAIFALPLAAQDWTQGRWGRFHIITYDNNETFRPASGGGPNRWPPDIEAFVGERREFLLGHPALFPEGRL